MARRPRAAAMRRKLSTPRVRPASPPRRRRRPRAAAPAKPKDNHRIWPGKLQPVVRGECRWCGASILRRDGQVNRRRTFCGVKCLDAYLLRTDPKLMRQHVYRRDNGICQGCGLVFDFPWDSGWEADHIVPLWVAHKFGDLTGWDPENVQLLCVPCHKVKTQNDRLRYAPLRDHPRAAP